MLHVKSVEIDLQSKPDGLTEGQNDLLDVWQQCHLNKSLVKFGRFSTDC